MLHPPCPPGLVGNQNTLSSASGASRCKRWCCWMRVRAAVCRLCITGVACAHNVDWYDGETQSTKDLLLGQLFSGWHDWVGFWCKNRIIQEPKWELYSYIDSLFRRPWTIIQVCVTCSALQLFMDCHVAAWCRPQSASHALYSHHRWLWIQLWELMIPKVSPGWMAPIPWGPGRYLRNQPFVKKCYPEMFFICPHNAVRIKHILCSCADISVVSSLIRLINGEFFTWLATEENTAKPI